MNCESALSDKNLAVDWEYRVLKVVGDDTMEEENVYRILRKKAKKHVNSCKKLYFL